MELIRFQKKSLVIMRNFLNEYVFYYNSLKLHNQRRPLSLKSDTIKKRQRVENTEIPTATAASTTRRPSKKNKTTVINDNNDDSPSSIVQLLPSASTTATTTSYHYVNNNNNNMSQEQFYIQPSS